MSRTASSPGTDSDASAPHADATGFWPMLKRTFNNWNEDNALRLAAAMACYVMLALAPMLVIFIKVVPDDVVRSQVGQLVGPAGQDAIGEMIKNAHQQGGGVVATVVSFAIVLVSASGVFVALQDALNTIWEVKPRPDAGWWQWVQKRFLSIGMVFGIAILLLSSMAVTALLSQIVDAVFGADRTGFLATAGAYALDVVVTVGVAWVLFMGVFRFLPDVNIAWRDVWLGAVVTAVLFKTGQIAMAIYFQYGSTTSAYGAFGSLVAVLLWAYYSSAILFLGAEFTQVWARVHGRTIAPENHAVKVTEEDRSQQGLPSRARVAAAPTEKVIRHVAHPAPMRSAPPPRPMAPSRATAAVGAAAAGLAAWYFLANKRRLSDRDGAAAQLNERIDRIEHEIRRAGRHVRAEETRRPLWMVRLGDLVGGRWSNT